LDAADVPGVRRIAKRRLVARFGGGTTPIWFARVATGMVGAAWSNSAAASALDLDDGNRLARGHPGAAVIPAAFALASPNASLDEIVKAIIVGYEVGVSVGAARRFWARTGCGPATESSRPQACCAGRHPIGLRTPSRSPA